MILRSLNLGSGVRSNEGSEKQDHLARSQCCGFARVSDWRVKSRGLSSCRGRMAKVQA